VILKHKSPNHRNGFDINHRIVTFVLSQLPGPPAASPRLARVRRQLGACGSSQDAGDNLRDLNKAQRRIQATNQARPDLAQVGSGYQSRPYSTTHTCMFIVTDAICISCHRELSGVMLSLRLGISNGMGLAEAQTISPLYSRWAPLSAGFPFPFLPCPRPRRLFPAPDLPRRVGAQSTHRRGEPIEADQASRREIWRGADHQRRRAKCSSFSRRWSRDPDRASRTSPTPSASPTPPLGAHGRTTAEAPGYAPRTLLSSRYSPPGAGG
jgi:hypothetical protein